MEIILLGCGSSGGVPLITGEWGDCNPNNPKNRRRRSSVLVKTHGKTILIDASPDLREQLLEAKVNQIDAIILTHDHADHIFGLPEMRQLYFINGHKPIPVFANHQTLVSAVQAFTYAFQPISKGYPPFLESHVIEPGTMEIFDIPFTFFEQDHGFGNISYGIRVGNFGYSTDFLTLNEKAFEALEGLDLWIVDCLRLEEHPTHTHMDRTLAYIDKVKPKQAVLTHMAHQLDYDVALNRCPEHVVPGCDGMVFRV